MIYFITTCILDVTAGIIHWTSNQIFSYIWNRKPTDKYIEYMSIQHEYLQQHIKITNEYKNIIQAQQKQIQSLLEPKNEYV